MKKFLLTAAMAWASYAFAQNTATQDTTAKDTTKVVHLGEAIVTATRAAEQSPTAFTNVNKQHIEKQNLGQDIPYLLSGTPSVVVTSDAGTGIGYTGMRIRGSDATRVNVTINGIPVNDAESHGVYWVNLPDLASSVESIQIQRGVGTSTNGAGAFGGSVNIQTYSLSKEPYAAVNSSAGSFDTWKNTVSFGTGLLPNKFAFDGRLSKIISDGFIDRGSSDLKSFYLSGGYYGKKHSLKTLILSGKEQTYQAWNGVPEAKLRGDMEALTTHYYNNLGYLYFTPQDSVNLFNSDNRRYNYFTYHNQTDNYQQDYYQLHYTYSATPELNLNASLHYTYGRGYYEEFKRQQALTDYNLQPVVIGGDAITETDLIRQKWLDNDFYGVTFSANYEKKDLQLTLGGAGNRYDGRHFDRVIWAQYFSNGVYPHVYSGDTAIKDDINVFAKSIYSIRPSLHLFADVQYRTVSYSFLGFFTADDKQKQVEKLSFLNPKAGVTYDINTNHTIYASVAVGNKEPIRKDYIEAAPGEKPLAESMTDLEAGYKYSRNKVRFSANYYLMNYKDQLIVTGRVNDVGEYIRENVPVSFREGIELEAQYSVLANLSVQATATISRNKIKEYKEYLDDYDNGGQQVNIYSNTDIAFSPSLTAAGMITYSPFKSFTADFRSRYVGQQYLDNTMNEQRRLNDYAVCDLLFSYAIKTAFTKELTLRFGIYNLLDRKFESNGYTYSFIAGGGTVTENFYYPQAGRNFLGGISIKF